MTTPHDESGRPAERPLPAYGELAPEGWEWKPETTEGAALQQSAEPRGGAHPGPGVPHNLGVRGDQAGSEPQAAAAPKPPTTGRPGDPEPYRAAAPQQPQTAQPLQQVAPATPGAPKSRTVDRVFTIILLVLGAFGALQIAGSLMSISASFSLVGSALELEDFSVPAWIGSLGTISAIVVIALYAVSLIFSIQRMRAGKLTFWVPLTAGAIAVIGTIVLTTVMMFNVPELVNAASDPSSTGKILDYFENMSQP
ncbi:DUF6264 family protein [Leucobacter musarum]|uniref:DUF6264 family protein n=1 Tax=Leucobacter musarum TaxID=1930747 RepID=UPI0006A770A9|nr:DUF6264 family protein [Leucobacter musarum]